MMSRLIMIIVMNIKQKISYKIITNINNFINKL